MSRTIGPASDEVEVSVFGTGRGEAIVIHLGNNEWCVVDSCWETKSQSPVAYNYLTALSNDALSGVKLIVATHWHDDHIRGISEMLRVCPAARFCCSTAVREDQFRQLVAASELGTSNSSGVNEFRKIFKLLLERRKQNVPQSHVAPVFAAENRTLLRLSGNARPFEVSISSLSPSDGLVRRTMADMGKWLPSVGKEQAGGVRDQNDTSVVLWVEMADKSFLFGGDLEVKAHAGEGWHAVIGAFHGSQKATVYKVPHHGSPNADCDEIWSDLLAPNPHALLTPFTSGKGRPQDTDVQRLLMRTDKLYFTGRKSLKPLKRDQTVEKQVKGIPRKVIEFPPGQVRMRWAAGQSTPTIEFFGTANQLS